MENITEKEVVEPIDEAVAEDTAVKEPQDDNFITEEQSKLAKDILKIIANSDIRLGVRDTKTEAVRYKETSKAIIALLYNKNVLVAELDIYFQLLRQAIGIAEVAVEGSLELSQNIALTKFWGKHPEEITLQDIDQKMK